MAGPRLVKLGPLLPEDIAFELPGGQTVVAPGDPPLQLILKIVDMFESIDRARGSNDQATVEVGLDMMRDLDAEVLGLLKMRDPSLTESPFGVIGVQHFVAELLKQYGIAGGVEDPPPTKTGTTASRKRSGRSSGSRSS